MPSLRRDPTHFHRSNTVTIQRIDGNTCEATATLDDNFQALSLRMVLEAREGVWVTLQAAHGAVLRYPYQSCSGIDSFLERIPVGTELRKSRRFVGGSSGCVHWPELIGKMDDALSLYGNRDIEERQDTMFISDDQYNIISGSAETNESTARVQIKANAVADISVVPQSSPMLNQLRAHVFESRDSAAITAQLPLRTRRAIDNLRQTYQTFLMIPRSGSEYGEVVLPRHSDKPARMVPNNYTGQMCHSGPLHQLHLPQ